MAQNCDKLQLTLEHTHLSEKLAVSSYLIISEEPSVYDL